MSGLAELGEIAKGAWGNSYGSYGQDDMHNYKGGRTLAAVGAAGVGASGLYGVHGLNQSLKNPETRGVTRTALRDLNRNNDLVEFKNAMRGTKYAPKLKRARTGAKLGGAALLAAPLVGAANAGRKRFNRATNGQMNF